MTGSLLPVPRRTIGTAVSVLDGAEIELRGYDSLADALRSEPGIAVANSGGLGKSTTLRIRGEEPFRTLLMIDGVKALDVSAPQVVPTFDGLLATADLQRVEVLRGPQGFIYGADAGGVVNVLTARGDGPIGGRVEVERGAFGTERLGADLSGGGARGDYFVSVADLSTDGFNAATSDTVLRDRDGADNTTVHAKLGLDAGEAWRLELVARSVDAATGYDGCFSPLTFAAEYDCVSRTRQTAYRLSAEHDGARATHSFAASSAELTRHDSAAGEPAFAADGTLEELDYTGSVRPNGRSMLVYGADLERQRVATDQRLAREQRGYYVEYEGALARELYVSLGARYDDDSEFGAHTSARASIAHVRALGRGDSLKYRASYGTGFRAPSLYEIAYDAGPFAAPPAAGLRLGAETSAGYDLGVEYDRASGLHLEATLFRQRIDDEIVFDLAAFSGYLQAPGTSLSQGVELAARAPLGEHVQLLTNWTVDHTEDASGAERLRHPKDIGNFGVRYDALGKLALLANLRLARGAVDVGAVPLDDYRVLDVSASYTLSRTLELYGRVENAADAHYEEVRGYNTGGRAVYAGARVRF